MRSLLLAVAALVLAAPPAHAQGGASAVAADPHERVYETIVAQANDGPMIEGVLGWMVGELAKDPNLALLAEDNPGLLEALRDATRPIIVGYSQRVKREYRPRMIALLESELTDAEAGDIADFYATPIGRRLIAAGSENYRPAAVLDTMADDRRVSTADVQHDLDSASAATLRSLSAAETEQLYRELESRPAIARLASVAPKIAALRAQMEEEPLTADEEAAIDAALRGVFESLRPLRKGA